MSLFKELKRRNVFRVGIAFAVTAWLILQIGEVMAPALRLPDWVMSALAFFLILGFPIVLVAAWAFELTPEGIKRESQIDRSRSVASQTGRKLDLVIIGVLVLAVGVLLFERFLGEAEPPTASGERRGETAAAADAARGSVLSDLAGDAGDSRKAIAVLPFQNLSSDEENAYFAAGVHEDILTYLSRVSQLRVNSRTSVKQYDDTQLNLREVANQLGARYIVEGSVRRAGNQVRVTAQLIDAATDAHLWAENFDRELTDIFVIQTAVAREIVAALEAELTPREARMLERPPTNSVPAYDLYLQARQAMASANRQNVVSGKSIEILERAVALDPEFSRAWALLAVVHGEVYWFLEDRSPARLERMKAAADRALAIDPDLPEGLIAMAAYHYRGFYEYQQALDYLERARQALPNDPLVHDQLGLTLRRLGHTDASIDAFLEAYRLDPANSQSWGEAVETATFGNRPERVQRLVATVPGAFLALPRVQGALARALLLVDGNVAAARELLDGYPSSDNWYHLDALYATAMAERRFRAAADVALNDAYQESIARGMGRVMAAIALELGGFMEESRNMLDEVDAELAEELEKDYADSYAFPHVAMAQNQVMRGEHEEALASCARATTILPFERDRVHGAEISELCAWVKARAGEIDEALDDLERTRPVWNLGPRALAIMPEWQFMRGNPRFDALAGAGGQNVTDEAE